MKQLLQIEHSLVPTPQALSQMMHGNEPIVWLYYTDVQVDTKRL